MNLRLIFLSVLCGVLAGASAALFLISLEAVTQLRTQHPALLWGLPLAGLFIGLMYHHFGKDVAAGNNLILDEIHQPRQIVPLTMAPLIFVGTILTHLFGGSAGREGTAVQMGASLSDQLSRFFKIDADERKTLLTAGAGAGFGAAIGAPWAGVIFGMEVLRIGGLRFSPWFPCFIASFVGYGTAVVLRAPHSVFTLPEAPVFAVMTFLWVALVGVVFGLAARAFTLSTHFVENNVNRWIRYPPLKPFLGGVLLLLFFRIEGSDRYAGLGIPFIQEALTAPAPVIEPILKSIFTTVTLATGFKGGEFVPLVFIGTTLGSALSAWIPVSVGLLAALGFAAVFGAAANTPLACTVMAMEIFGWRVGPYALVACFVSYGFSGHHGIYKAQRVHRPKHAWLVKVLRRQRS